jgi:hypothetical protein
MFVEGNKRYRKLVIHKRNQSTAITANRMKGHKPRHLGRIIWENPSFFPGENNFLPYSTYLVDKLYISGTPFTRQQRVNTNKKNGNKTIFIYWSVVTAMKVFHYYTVIETLLILTSCSSW